MHSFSRLSALLAGLCFVATAQAASTGVQNLHAQYSKGQVHVMWDAPTSGSEPSYYHIYFAKQSIMGNGGKYDDFDTVTGKQTDFILTDLPAASLLYIAVLPVGNDGKDIGTIDKEITVGLGNSAAVPATDSTVFQLLNAQPVSATGILLTFTMQPGINPADAAAAFHVTDGTGHTLTLTRISIQGSTALLTTVPQAAGVTYVAQVSSVVFGTTAGSAHVPLDAIHSTAISPSGIAGPVPVEQQPTTSVPTVPSAPVMTAADVSTLQIEQTRQSNGRYTLIVSWDQPSPQTVTGYSVEQTRDGQTYDTPATLDATVRTVRLRDVEPGPFGIRIRAMGRDGTLSFGQVAMVQLEGGSTPVQNRLPQSGPGLEMVLALSGGFAGWKRISQYRKTQKKS